jgi:agmatine/peptidylarginine deiminase
VDENQVRGIGNEAAKNLLSVHYARRGFLTREGEGKEKNSQTMLANDYSLVKRLLLIYPEGVVEDDADYGILAPFYDELIGLVPENIQLIALVQTDTISRKLMALRKNLECFVHGKLMTIWLRDVAGFSCGDRIVKPRFRPAYYQGAFRGARRIDCSMECIAEILGKDLVRIPLIWDCGNLVTNGTVGIITERLLKDNPEFSTAEIATMIRHHLGIEPIFIPELRGDVLSHSDGYVAFVDEHTAVVSAYPTSCAENRRQYVDSIAERLINLGFDVARIQENPEGHHGRGDDVQSCVGSARGIYVNYLMLNETIVLPAYSFQQSPGGLDYNAVSCSTMAHFDNVLTINCDRLAGLGGVLHCISFTDR